MNVKTGQIFSFGEFTLDAQGLRLMRDDKVVPVTAKALKTLLFLIENRGRVVGRDELLGAVWQDAFVEENVISVNVSNLRKILGDDGNGHSFIKTVPRKGYLFVAPVETLERENAAASADLLLFERRTRTEITFEKNDEKNAAKSFSLLSNFKTRHLAAALILLMTIAGGWFYFGKSKTQSIKSIAVLPLKSFDAKNDELRLRIADALITKLGNLNEISVRPTNSILRFAAVETDAVEAGKNLEVDAVLDGRIQIEGERLRVTLQLVSVQTGEQLWSEQFDGKSNEILNLQDKIAAALLPKLAFTDEQKEALTANPTTNAEAYENYLKGRYLWNKRRVAEMQEAVQYFERAIALDADFALAYAGLADTYSQLANYDRLPRYEGYAQAKEMARKALAIDPNLSEAYSALGWVLYKHEWNWAEAEEKLARAIELNPNNAEAHHWRGLNFITVGKTKEYYMEMEKARRLAPLVKPVAQNYYRVVLMKEGCAKAFEFMEKFQSLYQTSETERNFLYTVHFGNCEDYKRVIALNESVAAERLDAKTQAHLAAAYAKTGKRSEALEILEHLKQTDSTMKFYLMPYVHVALGDADAAFADLERAFETRDDRLTNLKYDNFLAPLRSDTRFKQLLKKMNLPE